jgi:hypothetical protein
MSLLESVIRIGRKPVFSSMLVACLLTLGTTPGFSISPIPESVQATYLQNGNVITVKLVIYDYTAPSEKQILAKAFGGGQDQGLAVALSKTKAAGHCSIAGSDSFEIAFIQMVVTPTGRQITFITSRPLQSDEVNPSSESESFDMLIGQFDINDNDNSKSTGFLYPASRLSVDEQGKLHYDLAANPWSLINIFDSNWTPALAERRPLDAVSSPIQQP